MKKLLLALALLLSVPTLASAQCNGVFANNTVCGNVTGASNTPRATPLSAFPTSPGGSSGQIQYNNAGALAGFTMVGDCTVSIPNITCTKTSGVPFAASATTDTTNATNIASGTLNTLRLPSPFTSGTRSGNTSVFGTTSGAMTTGNCVTIDGSGNLIASGGACTTSANAELGTFTPSNASPAAETIRSKLRQAPVMCEDYSGGCTAANIQTAMTDAVANSRCFQFNGTYTVTTTISLIGTGSNPCFTGKGGLRGPASGAFTAVLEFKNFTGVTVDGNITIDCNSNAYIGAGLKIWSSGVSAQFQDIGFSEYANCRQAIQIGDPSQSTLPLSEINITRGFFFNVAQGIRVWSSNAVVNVSAVSNNVDPNSSGTWNISFTATCTGTSVAVTAINANGYLDQYDVLSGTGMPAGTYIVGQVSGTIGGNGTYTVNQACTSAAAAITSQVRGINVWTSGGTVNMVGGEVVNTVVNNGYLCVVDIMASPNAYGNCSFTGSTLESGGSYAASFNPTGIVTPNSGGLAFTGNRGFVGGLTTTDLIVTDATFPGNISISNNRFFATGARSGRNVVANTSLTNIYADAGSFGANMLGGTAGFVGGTQTFNVVNINYQFFTSGGTYTRTGGTFKAYVECVGAGGSGGSVAGVAATFLAAGGGGGGGYAGAPLTAAQIGASQTVTLGTGGTAPAAGNNNGNAGTASSVGTLVVAGGGAGGGATTGTGNVGSGGAGGTGTTGNVLIQGEDGGGGSGFGTAGNQAFYTGRGGGSARGFGTQNNTASGASNGTAGHNYGGGGSGATSVDVTNRAGGAGANGYCQVTEYQMQ